MKKNVTTDKKKTTSGVDFKLFLLMVLVHSLVIEIQLLVYLHGQLTRSLTLARLQDELSHID